MGITFAPDGRATAHCDGAGCTATTPAWDALLERDGWSSLARCGDPSLRCPAHRCNQTGCDLTTDRAGCPCARCRRDFAHAWRLDAMSRCADCFLPMSGVHRRPCERHASPDVDGVFALAGVTPW